MRGCPRATWGRRGTWGAPRWQGAGGAPAAQWGAWGVERPPRAQGLPWGGTEAVSARGSSPLLLPRGP